MLACIQKMFYFQHKVDYKPDEISEVNIYNEHALLNSDSFNTSHANHIGLLYVAHAWMSYINWEFSCFFLRLLHILSCFGTALDCWHLFNCHGVTSNSCHPWSTFIYFVKAGYPPFMVIVVGIKFPSGSHLHHLFTPIDEYLSTILQNSGHELSPMSTISSLLLVKITSHLSRLCSSLLMSTISTSCMMSSL